MQWSSLSLAEQLGNVGSDFDRALRWKEKGQAALALNASIRALQQLDQTLADDRHTGLRRREIARVREEVCRELFSDTLDRASTQQLHNYFLAFATAAQRSKGL